MVFVGGANISWACMLLNLGQVSAPLVKLQMAETETAMRVSPHFLLGEAT